MSLVLHVDGRGKDLSRYEHAIVLRGDAKIGKRIDLDGTGDYLENVSSLGNLMGNGVTNITVAMSFKADVTSGNDGLFCMGVGVGEIQLALSSNDLLFKMNGGGFDESIGFTDTWWTRLVLAYNGVRGILYLDGDEVINEPYTSGLDMTGLQTFIGAYFSSTYPFDGLMDNVSVYDNTWNADMAKYDNEKNRRKY